MLRCAAPIVKTQDQEARDPIPDIDRCGGELTIRDELTLLCQECGAEYPVRAGIPDLRPDNGIGSTYLDDAMVRQYYEMHLGPFIEGPQLTQRLHFPQPDLLNIVPESGAIEGLADIRQTREHISHQTRELFRSISYLSSTQSLTEEFYQFVLDVCQPYVSPNSVALDAGCGLGRMTAEIGRLGPSVVIGLDASPRMLEEATHCLTEGVNVPVALNMTAGHTATGTLTTNWPTQNLAFIVGDVQALPLKNSQVDLALCLNVLDRVRQPSMMVSELGRVLKIGGHLVISDPYDWDDQETAREYWTTDMTSLFASDSWRLIRAIDGIPFVVRAKGARRVTLYMCHCLVLEKR